MATPLPAVPPPPGPMSPAEPERDPLADRANAAALDATLSKGRNALFDATLDRPIPSRMQPPAPNAPSSPGAARRRFARKMEALDARRDRAAFAHEVAKRQGAARVATAQEFEDVRKRSRARTQAALRAQRAEAVLRCADITFSRVASARWRGGSLICLTGLAEPAAPRRLGSGRGQGRRCFVRQEHGRRRAAERGEGRLRRGRGVWTCVELLRETFVNVHAIEQTRLRGSPEV